MYLSLTSGGMDGVAACSLLAALAPVLVLGGCLFTLLRAVACWIGGNGGGRDGVILMCGRMLW